MKFVKVLSVFFAFILLAALPVKASNIPVESSFDFKLALDYAFQANIDTIFLTTDGGIYTTSDTLYMQIKEPLVIMVHPDSVFDNMPVFTHSDADSSVLEIFRIHDDVTFEGVIFDGYNAVRPMKYALRVGHGPAEQFPRVFAKIGLNIHIKNCVFRNIYPPNWQNSAGGNAFYFLRPDTGEPIIQAGNIVIEDCIFRNIGDEAIRLAETEKYPVERVCDTLIVRNCTFKNIAAECIRFYADTDTNTTDAYLLFEHLTIDSSATRTAFIKNNQFTQFRDVIVTNNILPKTYRQERGDYVAQVQQRGSLISHIDTLNIHFTIPYAERISGSKGAEVDTNTVYGFDPLYTNPDGFDYTLLPGSQAYSTAYSGLALGDLRWADPGAAAIDDDVELPREYVLQQNYPNPFNPSTSIAFSMAKSGDVLLEVYSITGRKIAELVNGFKNAGSHMIKWNASGIASGVYFYKLSTDGQEMVRKMVLMK